MKTIPDNESIIDVLLGNAKKYPGHPVLFDELHQRGIDYHTLDILSAKVYRWLKDMGLGKEDFILINLPRGVLPVIAIVGIWRAGCAFVLVEAGLATERIDFIRKDCGSKAEINESSWSKIMLCEPLDGHEITEPHDASYAVYTSGTTGKPKGVLHEVGNVMQTIQSHYIDGIHIVSAGEKIASIAPLSFMGSIIYIIFTLYFEKVSLYIVPYSIVKNPGLLLDFFHEKQISMTFLPPSYIRRLPGKLTPYIKKMNVGAEPASGIYLEGIKLYNSYAMSESGFSATVFVIDRAYDTCPVGKPRFDIDLRLVGEDGKDVPDGQMGEVCFTNHYVRGYINLPEETKAHFRSGWYYTGDLAKRDLNGNIILLGRSGDMIKINGNRIEPMEIEAAIKRILQIDWAAVRGFEEEERSYICAYYTDDIEVDSQKLRSELLKYLPYYMLPTYYVRIDEVPLNSNGKFDRKALPKPKVSDYINTYVQPENEIQEKLCTAFSKVLKLERVGICDDFYEMGGDSLAAMSLVMTCDLPGLDVSDIFRGRTPEGIGRLYESAGAVDDTDPVKANDAAMKEAHPLTVEQLYMFDYQMRNPRSTMYNLFTLLRFDNGSVDMEKMAKAAEAAMKNHPALLTTCYFNEDGELMQRFTPEVLHPMSVERMTEWVFHNTIKDNLVQPFRIADSQVPQRLSRCRVFETEKSGYLFFDVHHFVMDGTSFKVFFKNLFLCYFDKTPGQDFYYLMLKQRETESHTALYEESRAYFEKHYSDHAWQTYPVCDHEPPGSEKPGEICIDMDLDLKGLAEAEKKYRVSRNEFFITSAAIAISVYNDYPDILMAWNYNGRKNARMMDSVGLFFRELPVAYRFDRKMTIRDIFALTKEQVQKGIEHSIYPYVDLKTYGTQKDVAYLLYQQDIRDIDGLAEGIAPQKVEIRQNQAATQTILDIEILDGAGGLKMLIDYDADRYEKESMERFKDIFMNVSRALVSGRDSGDMTFSQIADIAFFIESKSSLDDLEFSIQ